jgi:CheY-like chemotaxis protein
MSTEPSALVVHRVLVVEDDLDSSQLAVAVLACEGFEPVVARNGREALDLLTMGLRPQAILLDLTMPIMDGREFRSRQRRQPDIAAIPVIICSAIEPSSAADLAAYAVFRKPLDFDAVIAVLRSIGAAGDRR